MSEQQTTYPFDEIFVGKDRSLYTFRARNEQEINQARTCLEQLAWGKVEGTVLIKSYCLLGPKKCGHSDHPPSVYGLWVRLPGITNQRVCLVEVNEQEQLPVLFDPDPHGRVLYGKSVWVARNGQTAVEHYGILIEIREYERRIHATLPVSDKDKIAEHAPPPFLVQTAPISSSSAEVHRALDRLLEIQGALIDPSVSEALQGYGVNVALLRQALDIPVNPKEFVSPPPLPWWQIVYTKVTNFFGFRQPVTHPAFATGQTAK